MIDDDDVGDDDYDGGDGDDDDGDDDDDYDQDDDDDYDGARLTAGVPQTLPRFQHITH